MIKAYEIHEQSGLPCTAKEGKWIMKSLVESTGRAEVGRTTLRTSVPPHPTTKHTCLYVPHVLLYTRPDSPRWHRRMSPCRG